MSFDIDDTAHATAVKAAITTALQADVPADAQKWSAYDYDDVPGGNREPGALPTTHVLVSVERRYSPSLRGSAESGSTGWRVTARGVSTTVDQARWALGRVTRALNEQSLEIGDDTTTPLQFESSQPVALDDGHYAGLLVFTYQY